MPLGFRNEIWIRGARFMLCKRHERLQCEGRVLSGYEAARVIANVCASGESAQVRELYAELSQSYLIQQTSNAEVLRWFSNQLGSDVFGESSSGLVLVELTSTFGVRCPTSKVAPPGALSEAESLVRDIETRQSSKDFAYRGQTYRLAALENSRERRAWDSYHELSPHESQELLAALAQEPSYPPAVHELLLKAVALGETAKTPAARQQQLIMLRHHRELAVRERAPAPNAAPPIKRALKARPVAYIIVEVFSSSGSPMLGVRVEITTPKGRVSALATDEYGQTGLIAIDPGSCRITLPTVDQSRWTANGSPGQLVRKEPGRTHVVRPGECLSQLAHVNGIADSDKVWNHGNNASLKAKRKNPNALLPGDRLFIPGVDVAGIVRPTDATHQITVTAEEPKVDLVLTFKDHEGEPLQDEPYQLKYKIDGKTITTSGQLHGAGELREKVPASLMTAQLVLVGEAYRLDLGSLDPAHDNDDAVITSGAAQRLAALGFLLNDAPSPADVELATRNFQKYAMDIAEPSGKLDGDTCAKLEELYGV